MFAVIFFWTPPHFWALALWKRREYAQAEVPMHPVVAGPRSTRRQMVLYSFAMAACSLALIATPVAGPVYTVVAVVANGAFCWLAWRVWNRDEDAAQAEGYRAEKTLFGFSLTYLALLFAALPVDAALRGAGWG